MASSFEKPNRQLYDKTFLQKYNALSSIYASYLPNDIKEIFKWVNFIVSNVPKVQSAVDKYSSVAITSLVYLSKDMTELSNEESEDWPEILEGKLKIKTLLKELAFNLVLYGNLFISINFPILRTIKCSNCGAQFSKNTFPDTETLTPEIRTGEREKLVFKGTCPKCGMTSDFSFKDQTLKDLSKLKIINWNINNIELYEDEITGIKVFYYTPNASDVDLIKKGNKEKIFHSPVDIITAAVKNGKVKFNEDKILHVRTKKFNATHTAWGIPKLTSGINDMLLLLLLKKSNEKIYTDMIFPMRAMVPRVNGVDNNSIYGFIDGSQMQNKMKQTIANWKKDPTSIQFFPIPVEPISLFGEGKSLNLSGEIESYSNMILSALGIPNELISGGLSYGASPVSLRILQNELTEIVTSLEEVTNFIVEKLANFLHKKVIKTKLMPMKLLDDASEKQLIMGLLNSGKMSGHTALNIFGIDYREEQERMQEEQKEAIKNQLEIQNFQQELSTSLEDKIKQESMMENSNVWNMNQQAILQQADAMVQQLSQLPYGMKKSKLDSLEKENQVLYAVVKWRMDFQEQKNNTAAKYQ